MSSISKYANLPFIAAGEKDVYETDDLPEADQPPSSSQQPDASIEIIPSGGVEAYQKFASAESILNTKDEEKIESIVDRFKRLQREISDLRKEAAESGQDSSQTISHEIEDLFLNLENLHDVCFQKLDCSQMVRDLKKTKLDGSATESSDSSGPLVYELYRKPDKDEVLEMAKINALEQRLKRLESTLGLFGSDSAKDSPLWNTNLKDQSIMNVVANLSNKMVQLDQSALDRIDARLNLINEKLTQIGEKKSSLTELDKEQKLMEIYDCYVKVDQHRTLIPNVLERIQVLNDLQDQASKFSNTLNAMETIQADIRTSLSANRENLEKLKGLLEKTENIRQIVDDFQQRLNKIKQ